MLISKLWWYVWNLENAILGIWTQTYHGNFLHRWWWMFGIKLIYQRLDDTVCAVLLLNSKAILVFYFILFFTPQPSGLEGYCRHGPGGRAAGRAGGRAGGCQTCGTHISVTAWWIFSVRSSMELSRPVVVHCYAHLPICPIWACPWAENLWNLPQIGSRLCGSHISETAGWINPI